MHERVKQLTQVTAVALAILSATVACADNRGDGGTAGGNTCPADTNSTGAVDVDDLIAVILGWGPCAQPCPPPCVADVNDDCSVDVDDLIAVILGWGPCACNSNGVWMNSTNPQYSCALGAVSFNIHTWTFTQPGAMLRVFGAPVPMTGAAVSCNPGQVFSVTGSLAGSCTEAYTLSGTFNSANQFTGVFTAVYVGGQNCCVLGSCCVDQSFNITATRAP